jgi:hypothetical protein
LSAQHRRGRSQPNNAEVSFGSLTAPHALSDAAYAIMTSVAVVAVWWRLGCGCPYTMALVAVVAWVVGDAHSAHTRLTLVAVVAAGL